MALLAMVVCIGSTGFVLTLPMMLIVVYGFGYKGDVSYLASGGAFVMGLRGLPLLLKIDRIPFLGGKED